MTSKKDRFFQQNRNRIERLSRKFGSYATGVDKTDIQHYLAQFHPEHMPIALKMLEHVDYYNCARQVSLVEELARLIKGLTNNELRDVLFCPINSYSGTRADVIQNILKHKLEITTSRGYNFNEKFIRMADLADLVESTDPKTVVFVDDFIGSGNTMINAWGTLQPYENTNHKYFLGVLVAYDDGMSRLKQETFGHFDILAVTKLPNSARIFHEKNTTFTNDEKGILKGYCEMVESKEDQQYGYKNTQSLAVFQERAPNNAIPILHRAVEGWTPLFRRLY